MTGKMMNLKKYIDDLLKDYDENKKMMDELLEDEKVKKYADCYYENDKIERLLLEAKEEFEFERMRSCKHSFVLNKVSKDSDLTYNFCPICGVNNRIKVINPTLEGVSYHDKMIVEIYKQTAKNGMFPVNIYDHNKKTK